MVKALIFDLDGTLLNTIEDLTDAGNYVCRSHGWKEYSVPEFKMMVGHGIPNLVRSFSPEDAQSPEQLAKTYEEFHTYYGAHNMDKTCPYEGIPELLSFWKAQGVKLAVFSNKADEFSKEIVEHYFPGVFDAIRGTVKEVPIKPDPAGVYLLMEELGVSKEETRFIGDSDVDILTGHNAGLQALGVTWGFRSRDCLKQAGADRIADDPQELSELLGK